MYALVLERLEILVAVVALLGAAKSAYNGVLSTMWRNLKMISEVYDRQENMAETQEKLVNAVVALSIAESDQDRGVDPKEVEQRLREDGGVRDYLRDRESPHTPYTDGDPRREDDD